MINYMKAMYIVLNTQCVIFTAAKSLGPVASVVLNFILTTIGLDAWSLLANCCLHIKSFVLFLFLYFLSFTTYIHMMDILGFIPNNVCALLVVHAATLWLFNCSSRYHFIHLIRFRLMDRRHAGPYHHHYGLCCGLLCCVCVTEFK